MNHRLLSIFIFVSLSVIAHAQTVSINGKVIDAENGEPAIGTTVQVFEADTVYVGGAVADTLGLFRIADIKSGIFKLKISSLSYADTTFVIDTKSETEISLGTIRMARDAIMLDETVITALLPKMIARDDTIIYNADAIKNVTGSDFDPTTIKTTEDFQALIDELIAGGMEAPTGVMKEDWSLGAHYLAEVYEQQDDPDAFIAGIKDGSINLAEDAKFNALMDTFDVLKDNNYAKDSAISAEREVTEQKLAEGDLAFMFGGNWDWSVINAYDYSENMGMMPVPNDSNDGTNTKLVGGGSKYFYVDNGVSEEQQQAAKDFLNWLVYETDGQEFLVNTCALVPAFSNISLPVADPLGASVKAYTDADALIGNYNYLPDDHYAKCGAEFQKYLAGQTDRAGFADAVTAYWATAEVGAH